MSSSPKDESSVRMFLCGDVMLGRGIDQILPEPGDPTLHEGYVKDARGYVALAVKKNGALPKQRDIGYIWGDALAEMSAADVRIINLETSVTTCDDFWPGKGINYRMNPGNINALTVANIDVCCLANNHLLDWGYGGLTETLCTLSRANLRTAGAGETAGAAQKPARVETKNGGTVLVYAFGMGNAGIPAQWDATEKRPGVFLGDLSDDFVALVAHTVMSNNEEREGNKSIAVASIHWGGNWGWPLLRGAQSFAHQLIDTAGVHVVHGHSSHHVKAIEVYKGKLILYGCGDFLSDYEGIQNSEDQEYNGHLGLMYFPDVDMHTGLLQQLRMVPVKNEQLSVRHANAEESSWLFETMNREGERTGTRVRRGDDGSFYLEW